jgi:hypothetical protein
MSKESAVFSQMRSIRKDLGDKLERVRDDLAALGNDPKRLAPHKRRTFFDCGLGLRLLDDIEAHVVGGGTEDVPSTISHLIALLKQLQTTSLPGNATPLHGSPVTTPRPSPALRSPPKPPATR